MAFEIRQIPLADANAFVIAHHRHHGPLKFHLFSLGAWQGEKLCGVSIVFRPVSRYLDDGRTAEVARLATDGTKNACSALYAASAREAKRRGYGSIITYTLMSEPGASLRAAGWTLEKENCGKPGKWKSQRCERWHRQMSLFDTDPPAEYKKRWRKALEKEE